MLEVFTLLLAVLWKVVVGRLQVDSSLRERTATNAEFIGDSTLDQF